MRLRKTSLIAGMAVILVLLFMYLDFADDVGLYSEELRQADAIVVLAGGLGRIDKGVELLASGMADYLIIAGADKEATLESIFFNKNIKLDTGMIILENKSASTYENAVETRRIVEDMGIKSVIIITSFYHMKRASYIFNRIFPYGVHLHYYPVSTPNFDETAWWRKRGPVLLAMEFLKFYWYRVWV